MASWNREYFFSRVILLAMINTNVYDFVEPFQGPPLPLLERFTQ